MQVIFTHAQGYYIDRNMSLLLNVMRICSHYDTMLMRKHVCECVNIHRFNFCKLRTNKDGMVK